MKIVCAVMTTITLLGVGVAAQADVFSMGAGLTSLETLRVGDAGNSADSTGYGAVSYEYNIGMYEVTAAQYCDFLNHKAKLDGIGMYNTYMDTADGCRIRRSGTPGSYTYSVDADYANRPVNYVSYWDACRFANWLNNGQGAGSYGTGAYDVSVYNGDEGLTIQRKAGWKFAVASEDEWYKAAYYKGGNANAGYWNYATQSDVAPSNAGSDGYADPGNHANYRAAPLNNYTIGSPYYRTNAGEFENSASPYGTFDQNGNVEEWTERVMTGSYNRSLRGGCFSHPQHFLSVDSHASYYPSYESALAGFRIVQAVPEPSSVIGLACGLLGLVGLRRRRA